VADLAYPIKLDDDYPCRGTDALGELQTFDDLLREGMKVGPIIDGAVFPTGEVVRKVDGLWAVAELSEPPPPRPDPSSLAQKDIDRGIELDDEHGWSESRKGSER
jgi:hypothetical protein